MTAAINTPAERPTDGGVWRRRGTSRPLVPTGGCSRAGRKRVRIVLFDQRDDLISTGAPPARRTSPAAVTETLVNGDKTDMVNGTLIRRVNRPAAPFRAI
jgi:hypothetical protein